MDLCISNLRILLVQGNKDVCNNSSPKERNIKYQLSWVMLIGREVNWLFSRIYNNLIANNSLPMKYYVYEFIQ